MSWRPSGDATGYIISYTGAGRNASVTVDGGSTDNYTLTGLRNGATYTMSIVTTSQHFSSEAVAIGICLGIKSMAHLTSSYPLWGSLHYIVEGVVIWPIGWPSCFPNSLAMHRVAPRDCTSTLHSTPLVCGCSSSTRSQYNENNSQISLTF